MTEIGQRISAELDRVRDENGVRILLACESGSRGWGFASTDSDFDVRFIYAHPSSFYLSINEHKDTMDFPLEDELDLNGWDLKKALKLLAKSNTTVFEWLQSPIIYRQDGNFTNALMKLGAEQFSPKGGMAHYLGLTKASLARQKEQGDEQKLKTWFYILRSLFAAKWIDIHRSVPPMQFEPLQSVVDESGVLDRIAELLEMKIVGTEHSTTPPQPILSDYVEAEVGTLTQSLNRTPSSQTTTDKLDEFFRSWLA
ncbi:MAG: nucleotidyltransferase domain-containing protein [Verrucomicrobiota bacterium]